MDTTFDEVRRCPRCEELGALVGTDVQSNRSTIYLFQCKNPQCRWFDSAPWVRQRNPDGTWVQEQKHKKFFNNVPDRTAEVQAAIDAELNRSMNR